MRMLKVLCSSFILSLPHMDYMNGNIKNNKAISNQVYMSDMKRFWSSLSAEKVVRRVLAALQQQPGIEPKTRLVSGGKRRRLFTEQRRTPELLKKWWNVYMSGGIYAQAVDTYAYAAFANGYRLEGKESFVQEVEDNLTAFDFDSVGMQGIVQSLVVGDSIQEIVRSRGNSQAPVGIVIRDSATFIIDSDEYGVISGFTQDLNEGDSGAVITLTPAQAVHLQLIPSKDVYGISLIGRAYDDIMRDGKCAEASAAAIDRHGFSKWHIKVGQPGETVGDDVLAAISDEFEDIKTDNEITTDADISILPLDAGGLEQMEQYSNVSLMRAAAALGVPEELLGIRRSSTDATAVSRMEFFLRTKISAIQRIVARAYTLSYIDQVVPPGSVKLIFNDVREGDEYKKSEWISEMLKAIGGSSPETLPTLLDIFPKEWIRSQFNISDSSSGQEH